jgi:calcineurin-like phosphoesterase family protein
MNEIFLTSDLHLGHSANQHGFGGIIFHTKRPFSCIEEHDQFIIDQWNKTVGQKDTTYILGDFAWRNHNHYIGALRGKKIMITGSHDKMNQDSIRLFTEYHEGMLVRTLNKTPFVMTHCAMLVWERSHYGSINAHGHSHQRLEERDDIKRIDVGIDGSVYYTPWNVDFIIYKMSLKAKQEYIRTSEELDVIVQQNQANNITLFNKWKEIKNDNQKLS